MRAVHKMNEKVVSTSKHRGADFAYLVLPFPLMMRAQRFKLFAMASNSKSWDSDFALRAIFAWLGFRNEYLDEARRGEAQTLFVPSVVGVVYLLLRGFCSTIELLGWIAY